MMNFMKKISASRAINDGDEPTNSETSLGLMHLRKLFADFRHPSSTASQQDQEDKLYNMLPLFCKVFGNTCSKDMMEVWSDILQYCSHISKLMVTEIRRRASNQSTEAASCAIVKFLEIGSNTQTNKGWSLLTAINILSSGGQAIIDCMTAASLPSTLVKCLYLFFDLPSLENPNEYEEGSDYSKKEKRDILQRIFVQVLIRLTSHTSPAEELAKKDDLGLLFSAITSWCQEDNIMWRKSAGEVLVTLSRHGLSDCVVKYIHEKGCVGHCIMNMQKATEISPLELVDMFVTVFCFLKDSSEVSQILIDDFKACHGYVFLSEFLLKLEVIEKDEAAQALRNLVLLVGSLTTCGYQEIYPNAVNTDSLFQMPEFRIPQPKGKGVSVRNIQAFQVLQTVFVKASTSQLCAIILDVISSILHQDGANYFIIEPQHTLSTFIEVIETKPVDIQVKLFELIEFIAFDLNYIPCKELISLSILIKSQHSISCCLLCLKTLVLLPKHHSVYRDVFREVGLLEVMVTTLHRFSFLLQDQQKKIDDDHLVLGLKVMEVLSLVISGNYNNASVFRECGGARCVHSMVSNLICQQVALNIIQQLMLSSGGEEDMGILLGLIPSATKTDLNLKTAILKSLLNVLRESHRTRTIFRKVGGFVYVMSVLVSMEGCLSDPPSCPWAQVDRKSILKMLRTVFNTLTIAMRYEPANAKFFSSEVTYDSLTEAVRLLGCFSSETNLGIENGETTEEIELFQKHFYESNEDDELIEDEVHPLAACFIFRYMYDMALDAFERIPSNRIYPDVSFKGENFVCSFNSQMEPIIIHPAAILTMFHLIPAITSRSLQDSLNLKSFICGTIACLLNIERNQQTMCDIGFPHEILKCGQTALADESCLLHSHVQFMFEKLASQSLTPQDLRDFLRLGLPLNCKPADIDSEEEEVENSPVLSEVSNTTEMEQKLKTLGEKIPLNRIKCLVSITTPKDTRLHGSNQMPSFIEFDMRFEGFACLYLPSIAPQGSPTPSVVGGVVGTSNPVIYGGIGAGERVFPPTSGLTYSTWFCVERFTSALENEHPVRLLTIVRNIQGREENLVCLRIYFSSKDNGIIVSTKEIYLSNSSEENSKFTDDHTVIFQCPELKTECQWWHLVLVFHRASIMKNSNVTLFVNGECLNTLKLHYISPNLGSGTASPTAFTSVFSYVGTPPQLRSFSDVIWKQGPCYLIEDIVTATTAKHIYDLGPTYIGSFQAGVKESGEVLCPLVAEEKLIFGVHAHALSHMTIAKIRKIYNKVDGKSIAKQLAMSVHENATPIRMLHNTVAHTPGPARSFGAVVMGYLGVRVFCPNPVSKVLNNIGGIASVLGLIGMSESVEGMYASVKTLVCIVSCSQTAKIDMDRIQGYQMLALLYKKKQNLLNSHILHLTFSLVGTLNIGSDTATIPNKVAFEDLLCDLEIWQNAPELQKTLYEHLHELLTDSRESKTNGMIMINIGLVTRLLHILAYPNLGFSICTQIVYLIGELLFICRENQSLLRFGQYLASTIPQKINEKTVDLEKDEDASPTDMNIQKNIKLRNAMLDVIYKLILKASCNSMLLQQICDDILKILGFDWLMLFLDENLHMQTVVFSLKIIIAILRNDSYIVRFREGEYRGGWLQDMEGVFQNQMATMWGFDVCGQAKVYDKEGYDDISHIPGFLVLKWTLPKHSDVPTIYFLLMALMLGQHHKDISVNNELSLESIWKVIFGVPVSRPVSSLLDKMELCPDAAFVLLEMIRYLIFKESEKVKCKEYPIIVIQFLLFLYHNNAEFMKFCSTTEFIDCLSATLFPANATEVEDQSFDKNFKHTTIDHESSTLDCNYGILNEHPAHRYIIDFLRTIVVDSFSVKSSSVIDILLDVFPENTNLNQQKQFQTKILRVLMEHLLAADILLGEQAALPINGNCYVNVASNVFYFTSRVVDKLWQGMYTMNATEVFDFIINMISQTKRKAYGVSLDVMYRSLNRTVLFQLSGPMDTLSNKSGVLDTLQKLTSNRNMVFGQGNYDKEFLGCLCFCLTKILDNTGSRNCDHERQMLAIASRVWEEMYVCKKNVLEELFQTHFSDVGTSKTDMKPPDLESVKLLIQETALKIWMNYRENEKKPNDVNNEKTNFESKVQRVSSGVFKLGSKKSKRESQFFKLKFNTYKSWRSHNISLVKDVTAFLIDQKKQSIKHLDKFLLEEWKTIEQNLLRVRGLWGPKYGSRLDKVMLDITEGPCRMRKKMIPNDIFYCHYPYRQDMEDNPLKYKYPSSFDSKKYFFMNKSTVILNVENTEKILEKDTRDAERLGKNEEIDDLMKLSRFVSKCVVDDEDDDNSESMVDDCQDDTKTSEPNLNEENDYLTKQMNYKRDNNQAIIRLLGEEEKIKHTFRCARIQGLDTAEGLLLFGKDHFYVVDGFTLLKTKEIRDIESLPKGYHEPIIPKSCVSSSASISKKIFSKFAYDEVREVHKRRYLLQPIAIEIFSTDGRNYLLAFPKKIRNKVYHKFQSMGTAITNDAQQSVSGQKQNMKVESGGGIISNLIGDRTVTQRWERGDINNFQYLMHLNTLAGRCYNDLMQYPVFPWIIADYESKNLDYGNPASFRDLSKPMGAQSPERLQQFEKRYREWDDPQGETPPYHFGTHYSSAMIVASYLVRMEPFTQHFLKLQGGHFDLADRMFHSIQENWLSAAKNNMADVKELIPEFFYLPEFLVNANNFDLGYKQSGVQLCDVALPPWAKSDPREFIRAHREALESDYVSGHLNEWIDLIFGYKQNGTAAVEAVNVFHHLFYEGNVDIYSIDDPLKKSATIGFINNFGQIPKQLFKKPHPPKKLNIRLLDSPCESTEWFFYQNLENLRPSRFPIKELKTAVGQIILHSKNVLAVEQNKVLLPPQFSSYLAWGFSDLSIRMGNYDSEKPCTIFECSDGGEILCVACPNDKIFVTGGTSCVVNVWEHGTKKKKVNLKQHLYGHTEPVTCLSASQAYHIIVSGSRDQTCIIWDLNQLAYVNQLKDHSAPVAAICINELTGDIATCAGVMLYLWTVNGHCIGSVNTTTGGSQQILSLCMSQLHEWNTENVIITGSSDGVVRMWSLNLVQVTARTSTKRKKSQENDIPSCINMNVNLKNCDVNLPENNKMPYSAAILRNPKTSSSSEDLNINIEERGCVSSSKHVDNEELVWQRQLVFRSKLTMHTAYERKDNKEPAAITALGVSRDHRTVFVGDSKGRIHSWTMSDTPGQAVADHWMKDECAEICQACNIKFTFSERKHHCRNCGKVFCSRCSKFEIEIRRLKIKKPVRVCQACYKTIQKQEPNNTS